MWWVVGLVGVCVEDKHQEQLEKELSLFARILNSCYLVYFSQRPVEYEPSPLLSPQL